MSGEYTYIVTDAFNKRGIIRVRSEHVVAEYRRWVQYPVPYTHCDGSVEWRRSKWHDRAHAFGTLEDAVAWCEERRAKRIRSAEKTLEKLRSMQFTERSVTEVPVPDQPSKAK